MKLRFIVLFLLLSLFAVNTHAQREINKQSKDKWDLMRESISKRATAKKFSVMKLYPVLTDSSRYIDPRMTGQRAFGPNSPLVKGMFDYDPNDSLSLVILIDAGLLSQGLADSGFGSGGGGSDGVVNNVTYNSSTGDLTLGRSIGGNLTENLGTPLAVTTSTSAPAVNGITENDIHVDTDDFISYVWNGSSWVQMNAAGGGGSSINVSTSTMAPVGNGTTEGDIHIDTDDDIIYVWDGSTWRQGSHPKATITNNDAPFSWNTATQTGNIPTTSVTQNVDTITIDPGDGTGGITFVNNNAGAAQSISYYDSGQGFWVYATTGVVTTSPTLGNYTITIPVGGTIISFSKNFSNDATELTAGGEVQITVDHNTAAFNTSFTDAILPVITLMPSALSNQQYPPQSTGFTQPHGVSLFNNSVSAGATVQTITNVNGMVGSGNSMVVKGKF